MVIQWPVVMDITRATELMKAAGYTYCFSNCALGHPLDPGGKQDTPDEPYYVFEMEAGLYVFVGVKDGSVYVNKAY